MSRDGSRIVFKSTDPRDPDAIHIFIMNADGRSVRQLTRGDYADEDPAFSPDGRTIAFERMYGVTSHRGQNPQDYYFQEGIVSLDLATGRERRLTEADPCGKNELWLPTWSPDGEFIMFTRGLHLENGEFTHDLWVMRKDGTDLQPVPDSEGIMFLDWVR
jgi:Tol biopolymer transport system component